jgi:ArsR family transcriptional regulator
MINYCELVQILNALGEPVRLRIIFLLCEHQRLNVSQIASHFHISRPAISHHLRVMRDANVVQHEKLGLEVYYSLNKGRVGEGLRALAERVEGSSD